MSNYIDYLKWRGDLSFDVSPFCEVDAMILSELVYIDMKGLALAGFEFNEADCAKICRRFTLTKNPKSLFDESLYYLAEAVITSPRFAGLKIGGYRDETDTEKHQQFAVATFMLKPELYFVAFRGTDETLVGWKENLDLSYLDEIPSQKAAVNYLNDAVRSLKGKFYVGGHSKGGNLAVYATAFSFKKTSKQVKDVYNFDGPGFNDKVINKTGFHDITEKVHTYVPQNSLIGMLLKHKEPYTVIRSTKATGVTEHQLGSWQVGPFELERESDLKRSGKVINENISEWIDSMSYEEKKQFIDVVFSLVDKFDTVEDLTSPANLSAIMKAYSNLNEESKHAVSGVLESLGDTVKGNIKEFFQNLF